MEDSKEKILRFIKQKGPVLPVEIAKHSGRKTIKENDIKLAAQK